MDPTLTRDTIELILSYLSAVDLCRALPTCQLVLDAGSVAAGLRARDLGLPLPPARPGESLTKRLRFVELAARRPTKVAAGFTHSLAVDPASGRCFSWGGGTAQDKPEKLQHVVPLHHLGHGISEGPAVLMPTPVVGLGSVAIKEVAAAMDQCALLTTGGRIMTWGSNMCGALGQGDFEPRSSPTSVNALADLRMTQVTCGCGHMLALTAGGKAYSWGSADSGQLGIGSAARFDFYGDGKCDHTPRRVALASEVLIHVSAGGAHNLAINTSGDLFSWGSGIMGELGLGDGKSRLVPTIVRALSGNRVVHASAGDSHSLAADEAGAAYSWGQSGYGKLGHGMARFLESEDTGKRYELLPYCLLRRTEVFDGQRPSQLTPQTRVVRVIAGSQHSVLITEKGDMLTFGWQKAIGHGSGCGNEFEPICVHMQTASVNGTVPIFVTTGSAGTHQTIVQTAANKLLIFGGGEFGPLCTGTLDPAPSRPTELHLLED